MLKAVALNTVMGATGKSAVVDHVFKSGILSLRKENMSLFHRSSATTFVLPSNAVTIAGQLQFNLMFIHGKGYKSRRY